MEKSLEYQNVKLNSFVLATYKLLTGSLIAASAGAYLGVTYNHVLHNYFWGLVILEFVLLFATMFLKNKEGINVIMLFLFTTVSGLTLGPILTSVLGLSNGISIITNAVLLTACAFGGLTLFALTTKNNLLGMGKYLFIAVIILIVASIINIFMGSSLFQTIISAISAFIFSAFIAYDTQRLYSGEFETPVEGALSMYINIINLFVSILQLLKTFTGERD